MQIFLFVQLIRTNVGFPNLEILLSLELLCSYSACIDANNNA